MSSVESVHEEKGQLVVDVFIPGHEERTTTPLFSHSRLALIERAGGVCFVCGRTAEQSGHPLEAHHHPVERSFANMIDWRLFAHDCAAGMWGPHAAAFDWEHFLEAQPFDPYAFVDDMTVNGLLLCKDHHTHNNEGIHTLPFPVWLAQKYGKEGYQFSSIEIIHHPGQEPETETEKT